ncbi:alpha/beta-hydrolase [Exidia glandulosa HHB12029]|uniref:Alpha/beta-hydrolase n=1 Tax=Exidia glandulosa HHB12029 TaxID=1314781 RepID=A0A165GQR4_EXIGL|nr:alpha/beta-hydrolase [Exidia glandulosa HHB12029]
MTSNHVVTAPYGTWKSDISPDVLIQGASTNEVVIDQETGIVYTIESRPSEGGRCVLVQYKDGKRRDVFGKDWSARSGVHEYGGAALAVRAGVAFFSDFAKKRLHRVRIDEGDTPEPVTPDDANLRYGDFQVHPTSTHLLVSILEDHTKPAPEDVVNSLVLVDSDSQKLSTLRSGSDFYTSPQWSPSGLKLAWIEWNHPDMPWEGTQLYIASFSIEARLLSNVIRVAGKAGSVSVQQPAWLTDDKLLYLSDESGFYAPYLFETKTSSSTALVPAGHDLASGGEFAEPQWKLGSATYAVLSAESVIFARTFQGFSQLWLYSPSSNNWTHLPCDYVDIEAVKRLDSQCIVFRGWKADSALAVVKAELLNGVQLQIEELQPPSGAIDPGHLSRPQGMTLLSDSGEPLHVIYQPPSNKNFVAPEGTLPPCIVHAHGGPTGVRVSAAFTWLPQYFTNRGWAWLAVNYGGSSGYGRAYRTSDRLNGKWGLVDVNDCVEAVKQLGKQGLIDPSRVAIRGGSAGGYTVLQSVVSFPDMFAAATSSFGISDLVAIAADTHKFESQQAFKLLGGTPDQVPAVYKDRSPVHHADKIKTPLLILQGLQDAVVPPAQAQLIVNAVQQRGGIVKYIAFDGEGHGWRKAENIKRALVEELTFYEDVFGIKG